MKIELLQENLTAALNQLHRIIPNKPQLPILSAILLEANPNSIQLTTTDLYLGVKATVLGKVTKPQNIAIPGKIFYSSIASLDPGKLELSLENNVLTITSANNVTSITCLATEDFPEFPQFAGQVSSLKTSEILQIQDRVGFSASLDLTRPVLTALLFQLNQDGALVVGTDGYRLATLELSKQKNAQEQQILIPAKAIAEAARIATSKELTDVELKISQELKQAVIKLGDTELYIRLIDGEYPPFNRIIPSEFTTEVELDGKEFESQLKRAQIFARESSNIIRLQVSEDELKVVAVSPAYGQQEGVINLKLIKGAGGEIAFNARYLLDFVSTLKPEKISFYMNESLSPAMLRPSGEENYRYIVMPFRVNE